MVKRKLTREKKNRMKIQRVVKQIAFRSLLLHGGKTPEQRTNLSRIASEIANVVVISPRIVISLTRK